MSILQKARGYRPFDVAPNPVAVARRFAKVSGDASMNPDVPYLSTHIDGAGFAVSQGFSSDIAAVSLRRTVRGVPRQFYAAIGHLNPSNQEWNIYPEYVSRFQRRAVAKCIGPLATRSVNNSLETAAAGGPYIDVRHPLTQQARSEMSTLLGSLPLQRILELGIQAAGRDDKVTMDKMTTVHPSLATRLHGPVHLLKPGAAIDPVDFVAIPGEVLAIQYTGTRHQTSPGHTSRGSVVIPVAEREPGGWTPKLDTIDAVQWDTLNTVPGTLMGYRNNFSAFSFEACAVAHNFDIFT